MTTLAHRGRTLNETHTHTDTGQQTGSYTLHTKTHSEEDDSIADRAKMNPPREG